MKKFSDPIGGARLDLGRAGGSRKPPRPFLPYPAGKLERERAAFDLADAAQAATRAAILLDRNEVAESRRLDRVAHDLYARADAHCREAAEAHQTATGT